MCDACKAVINQGTEIEKDFTNHVGPLLEAVNAKEATCSEKGYTGDIVCDACKGVAEYGNETEEDESNHDWDEGTITTSATCSAKGVKTYTCKNNKEHTKTEDVEIDQNAHDWDEGTVTTAANCSA